MVSCSRRP